MKHLHFIFNAAFIFFLATNSNALSAQASKGNLTIEPYVFENAKKEKVPAEFGRLKVPENRNKRNSKMIEVAFVLFKSTSKSPGNPIVYLAGGPGGSGIGTAKFNRFKLFMAMREFGDVIALDQRGTQGSKPYLKCDGNVELPLDAPLTRESVANEAIRKAKVCAEKWKATGVDISAFNTVESADDIEDLRKALGAKKITLWGISYGTHLALATIRRHGKYIDRAILAGVEGVDDTLKLPSYTQNLIVALDKRLKADTELSKKVPDLTELIRSVHEKLDEKPVNVELIDPNTKKKTEVVLGKFDLQYLFAAFSGSNEAQAIMPKIYHDMSKGDFSFLGQQMQRFRTRRVPSMMSIAMDCASGISGPRAARIEAEKRTTLFSDAVNMPFPEICKAVNVPDLGKSFREPVKSTVPVLFISGTLDGRTPVSNAEFAQNGFKNSTHLIIDGAGHSDPLFLSTPKIKETMLGFMRGNRLPSKIEVEMEKPFRFAPIRAESSPANSAAKKIDDFIEPFANANHFSGVVLASRNGRIIYEKAFGLANVGHNVPNRIDTKFGIASINKPMTSVILLQLIASGKIGTRDKLSKYIPDFPNGDKITIGMLGKHRSGIKHRVMPASEETIRYTPAQFVEKAKRSELAFEPGTDSLYSSAGYAVLARTLEIASGRSFEELLKEYVFGPAKMNNSTDFDSAKIIRNAASCYLLETEGYSAAPYKDYTFLVGAGSVFSTARDIY
ncbi:MAG: alpha/beta fold hydrolase, partial [Pyrinomonadaceae bacterium]|nr:alpha/beta fold hydrolase [Pyrinomonadaceae bacterium]